MRRLLLLPALFLTTVLSAQVDHWNVAFTDWYHGKEYRHDISFWRLQEKYRTTYFDDGKAGETTIVDLKAGKYLLFRPNPKFCGLFDLSAEAKADTVEQVQYAEGADFEVLSDTCIRFGLVLHHVKISTGREEGEGWLVFGKASLSRSYCRMLNGNRGFLVAYTLKDFLSSKTRTMEFNGYASVPEGDLFSLVPPEGYELPVPFHSGDMEGEPESIER